MKYEFESTFASKIEDFISQKNALGFPYVYSSSVMRDFDRFCCENFPDAEQLTQEMCLAWATRKDAEQCNNSFRNRLMPIREFARYLNRIGEPAYILHSKFAKKEPAKPPYIYSRADIKAIWNILDSIKPNNRCPGYHLVLPAAIKLLYCCGLRPCEVRRLTVEDVDFDKGRLNILESKQHRSRIVMMADDVRDMLAKYHCAISAIMPGRKVFFPTYQGKMYVKGGLNKPFRAIREQAGVTGKGGIPPRLYDFRHTFATHRLYFWMKEGKNLYAMIPYLSAYMGHSQLTDTYYYIHFVPGMAESLSGCSFATGEELIPELSEHDIVAKNMLYTNKSACTSMFDFDFSVTANLIPEVM